MSPTFSVLLLFCSLVQIVLSVYMKEEGFAYDAIRIRDESPLFAESSPESPPRKPKRPFGQGGGSRYLRRNRGRKPGRKQLDKTNLMALLGEDYKSSLMSDEKPKNLIRVPSNEVSLESSPQWAFQRNLAQLNNEYNITAELKEIEPELLAFEPQIRNWLLKRTTCPMEFSWKDMGPTYWPRWVRQGECVNRGGFCSFPKGMHCVPGATTNVNLLFWMCSDRKHRDKRSGFDPETSVLYKNRVPHLVPSTHIKKKKKKCEWKKVPYPITVDCFCTC